MECSFDTCTKKVYCKKLCSGHYGQQRRGKELKPIGISRSKTPMPCTIEGCTEPAKSKVMCGRHYWQMKNHGYIKDEDVGEVQDDERRCNKCRQIKHWTKFARKYMGVHVTKPIHECLVCFKARVNPPKEEPPTITTEDLLRLISNGNTVD